MRFSASTLGVACLVIISSGTPRAVAFIPPRSAPQSSILQSPSRWINNSPASSFARRKQRPASCRQYQNSGGLRVARMSSSSPDLPAIAEQGSERLEPNVTELPDSFEDSIVRMARATLRSMEEVCPTNNELKCMPTVERVGTSLHIISTHAHEGEGQHWFRTARRSIQVFFFLPSLVRKRPPC